jgi:hypothetical protein
MKAKKRTWQKPELTLLARLKLKEPVLHVKSGCLLLGLIRWRCLSMTRTVKWPSPPGA